MDPKEIMQMVDDLMDTCKVFLEQNKETLTNEQLKITKRFKDLDLSVSTHRQVIIIIV